MLGKHFVNQTREKLTGSDQVKSLSPMVNNIRVENQQVISIVN
jgi:hypothetical protein